MLHTDVVIMDECSAWIVVFYGVAEADKPTVNKVFSKCVRVALAAIVCA
jgi:hypothetical protein